MSRQPRFVLPGYPQLLLLRGNNHQTVFKCQQDFSFYLSCLLDASKKYACHIHAYVLMPDHIHLLVTPLTDHGISQMMQAIGKSYVRYFNNRYKRCGTLWEGRYKATLVDADNYLLCCQNYIELNPVRADMVEYPSDYMWSSYHVNALGVVDHTVTQHAIYDALGESPGARQKAYCNKINLCIDRSRLMYIREAVNKQWVLGTAEYKTSMQSISNRQVSPKARGGDHKSQAFRGGLS